MTPALSLSIFSRSRPLKGRSHSELGETVYPPQFLPVDTMLRGIKIVDRAGKLGLETSSIERCYQLGTADSVVQTGEIFLYCTSQRVDSAESCYDYSPKMQ